MSLIDRRLSFVQSLEQEHEHERQRPSSALRRNHRDVSLDISDATPDAENASSRRSSLSSISTAELDDPQPPPQLSQPPPPYLTPAEEKFSHVDLPSVSYNATPTVAAADDSPVIGTLRSFSSRFARQPNGVHLLRLKIAACYMSQLVCGWGDGSAGPLIPSLQKHYNISYTIVSLIFVGQAVGFLMAAGVNTWSVDRFGIGKVFAATLLLQVITFSAFACGPPFPAYVVIYCVNGISMGLANAQANGYVALLPNSTLQLGYVQACYGIGALIAPLIATQFIRANLRLFNFYLAGLGLSVVCLGLVLAAFRLKPEENASSTAVELELRDRAGSVEAAPRAGEGQEGQMRMSGQTVKTVLRNKLVLTICSFLFLYCGAEVTMGGWVVSFLTEERNGNVSATYVATGFWAGIAISRMTLPAFNLWFGEKRVMWLYLAICVAAELLVWLVPNLIVNAIAVAAVGLALGTMYPGCISIMTKQIPRSWCTPAVGFAASIAQIGAATFPFFTGALAQRFKIAVLQPVELSLFASMALIWLFVPAVQRRTE